MGGKEAKKGEKTYDQHETGRKAAALGKLAHLLGTGWRGLSSWRVGARMRGGEAEGVELYARSLWGWGLWGAVSRPWSSEGAS